MEAYWWARAESNHRHGDFQSPALPTELQAHMVGEVGLEPTKPLGKGFTVPRNCHYATRPYLVHLVGLEPTRPFGHYPLKIARLPISPQVHMYGRASGIRTRV